MDNLFFCYKNITLFLINCYVKKLIIEKNNGKINNNQILDLLKEYMSTQQLSVDIYGKKYEIFTSTELENLIFEPFGFTNLKIKL